MRELCAYIMASRRNGTLYTGVTARLTRRVHDHPDGSGSEFIRRCGCRLLVWYERYDRIVDAIAREKQIKAGSRRAKLALIEVMNPDWTGLYRTLNQWSRPSLRATPVIASRRRSSPALPPDAGIRVYALDGGGAFAMRADLQFSRRS